MLKLQLFGSPHISDESSEPTSDGRTGRQQGPTTQRRRLALLAVIAASGTGGVSRDKILGLLWTENEPEKARHALTAALSALRHDLQCTDLVAGVGQLLLNPEVITSDVLELEEALAKGDLERIVALYRGPFLDGFYISDAPEFEKWVDTERTRYHREAEAALEKLAATAARLHDRSATSHWLRRLAALDPLNSRVTLELMRTLAAAGDVAGALRQARIHAALLEQEIGIPPDRAVVELAENLQKESPPSLLSLSDERETVLSPPVASGDAGHGQLTGSEPLRTPPDAVVPAPHADSSGIPGLASLAVLPFANLSAEPGDDYLSDGITEELINALARLPTLRVVARTSVFALKGTRDDVRTLGQRLNVSSILEGSVRRSGNRVRVTVQLVNTLDGYCLWSKQYERHVEDIFDVEDEITRSVILTVQGSGFHEEDGLVARATHSPDAHELYLKGRYCANKRTIQSLTKAVEFFEQALQYDPQFASALGGIAEAQVILCIYGATAPLSAMSRAQDAALTALQFDTTLSDVQAAVGSILGLHHWQWPAAGRAFRRAITLNPRHPTSHHWYAVHFLIPLGRMDEARAEIRRAQSLDPLSPIISTSLGLPDYFDGRFEDAEAHYLRALELDPAFGMAYYFLAQTHIEQHRFGDAIAALTRARELLGDSMEVFATLAYAYALSGEPEMAKPIIAQLLEESSRRFVSPCLLAYAYIGLGQHDTALDWLERGLEVRAVELMWLKVRPVFDPIRSTSRFQSLLQRVGLGE